MTDKSFRATPLTDFQVGVTKNLFEILIDHRPYLLEFYSKFYWTDRLKMALTAYQIWLKSMNEKIACTRVS